MDSGWFKSLPSSRFRAGDAQPSWSVNTSRSESLLASREAVWRSYFANDQAQLDKLVPPEAMSIGDTNPNAIQTRADILEGSKRLAAQGSKLVRLEFPKTEIQLYGDMAILYTTYSFEAEAPPDRKLTQNGRGIEVFVKRDGNWVNTGGNCNLIRSDYGLKLVNRWVRLQVLIYRLPKKRIPRVLQGSS
jgi:hypothetical protein